MNRIVGAANSNNSKDKINKIKSWKSFNGKKTLTQGKLLNHKERSSSTLT